MESGFADGVIMICLIKPNGIFACILSSVARL